MAYAVSWLLWLPLVATVQGWWDVDVPLWWHYTGAAGPITAAVTVTALTEGALGVRALAGLYRPSRTRTRWLAFAVLMPLVSCGAGLVVARLADGTWPTYDQLSSTDNLPRLGFLLTLLVHVFTFGFGEETGWRGFALPGLQKSLIATRAAGWLAIWWGLWHSPTFFENPSFTDMGPFQVVGWGFGLWMGSIFLAWLYNSSGGSLLAVVLWHGLFNQFSASNAPDAVPVMQSLGVILVALAAIRFAGPEELTGLSRLGKRQQHEPPA
jgi:membrane protease YdiL (CAAX protease family)